MVYSINKSYGEDYYRRGQDRNIIIGNHGMVRIISSKKIQTADFVGNQRKSRLCSLDST